MYCHDNHTVERAFPDLLEEILRGLTEIGEGARPRDEMLVSFWRSASLLKHRGFQEEREVRIVTMPISEHVVALSKNVQDFSGFPPLKKISVKNTGSRYLTLFETLQERLPITRIIVGASRNQTEDEAFARDLTKGAVPITLSETPYIGP